MLATAAVLACANWAGAGPTVCHEERDGSNIKFADPEGSLDG